MSSEVKQVNAFMKIAIRSEVNEMKDEILLTELQEKIFHLRYEKHKTNDYIADILGYSLPRIDQELKVIRKKIIKFMNRK